MSLPTLELPVPQTPELDCERCLTRWQTELTRLRGVVNAAVNSNQSALSIAYAPELVTPDRLEAQAREIGAELAARIGHETLVLNDLDCPDCAATIQKATERIPGVLWAETNFAAAQLRVEYEREQVSLESICKTVQAYGVHPVPLEQATAAHSSARQNGREVVSVWRGGRWQATLFCGLLTTLGFATMATPQAALAPWLFAGAILTGGASIARAGWMAVRARALDMNVLMTVAVIGAMGVGEWSEGATVVLLFNIGALLQSGALERTRGSIRALMNLTPKTARVRRGAQMEEVPVERVGVEEIVQVRPGERIPMDGVLISGRSAINEAPITGESLPVEKAPGDRVFGGTLNGSSAIELRVLHPYQETLLARIVHRVEEAQAQRAPAQEFIDRFARRYTPIVVGLAALIAVVPPAFLTLTQGATGVWGEWLQRALALLLIACPCALVISTPVAIVTAIGAAARRGALIKGGAFLEALSGIRVLLYDKTGTLTEGRCRLAQTQTLNALSEEEVLQIAAALEAHSDHPLASAFTQAAQAGKHTLLPFVRGFEATPGRGVRGTVNRTPYLLGSAKWMQESGIAVAGAQAFLEEAERQGRTTLILATEAQAVAVFSVADAPRPEAAAAVQRLAELGVAHQAMLTGDHLRSAQAIAAQIGIQDVRAELLPDDKRAWTLRYREQYGAVGMVGEGVNDAPALATADVGIVMGVAGSDTAMETADVALMQDDLSRLPELFALSRRTRAIVRQNVVFSLATKGFLLIAACLTPLPLWVAVLGDVGVSLLVTLNALRLRA